MNLESVEARCVEYLAQTSSPLAPAERVLRYVVQAEDCADVSERELIAFLRPNPLFRVVESLEGLGEPAGPLVALSTRIPSQTELMTQIRLQLQQMQTALAEALREASVSQDKTTQDQIAAIMAQAKLLQEKTDKMG